MARRDILRRIHAAAGAVAFILITGFLAASLFAETAGDAVTIAQVKRGIAFALAILVPALAATGVSGFLMSGANPGGLVGKKLARMRIIAANGLMILVPSALFLAAKADSDEFDAVFMLIQAVEYVAGGLNLVLMGLNIRDGLALTAKRRRSTLAP